MIFSTWYNLAHVVVVGVCAYVGLIGLLRLTGKRTLSKMNAFDLIVTVALGSTLASALLSKDVALAEALLAFVVLCALQFAVAYTSIRSKWFESLVKSDPTLVVYQGRTLVSAMRRERVTEEEIHAVVRASGVADFGSVQAVVLETDGSFSVICATPGTEIDTLRFVKGADESRSEA